MSKKIKIALVALISIIGIFIYYNLTDYSSILASALDNPNQEIYIYNVGTNFEENGNDRIATGLKTNLKTINSINIEKLTNKFFPAILETSQSEGLIEYADVSIQPRKNYRFDLTFDILGNGPLYLKIGATEFFVVINFSTGKLTSISYVIESTKTSVVYDYNSETGLPTAFYAYQVESERVDWESVDTRKIEKENIVFSPGNIPNKAIYELGIKAQETVRKIILYYKSKSKAEYVKIHIDEIPLKHQIDSLIQVFNPSIPTSNSYKSFPNFDKKARIKVLFNISPSGQVNDLKLKTIGETKNGTDFIPLTYSQNNELLILMRKCIKAEIPKYIGIPCAVEYELSIPIENKRVNNFYY